MVCQICGEKSGFYPLCKNCSERKDKKEITKCNDCGIWKDSNKPLCIECYLKNKKLEEKKLNSYKSNEVEKEDEDFRNKFKATIRAEDGHMKIRASE